jgi:hypothetical protein
MKIKEEKVPKKMTLITLLEIAMKFCMPCKRYIVGNCNEILHAM